MFATCAINFPTYGNIFPTFAFNFAKYVNHFHLHGIGYPITEIELPFYETIIPENESNSKNMNSEIT